MSPKNINGIVMPQRPTFDKIAALYCVLIALGKNFGEIEVITYSSTDSNDPILAGHEANGFYLIDVGNNKYQSRGTGSAVETVVIDFGLTGRNFEALVEIANRNNQTGYLKGYAPMNVVDYIPKWKLDHDGNVWESERQFRESGKHTVAEFSLATMNWSIVWLLREAYKVGFDVTDVIRHTLLSVGTWMDHRNHFPKNWESVNDSISWVLLEATTPEMTLPWMIRRLSAETAVAEFSFWKEVQKAVVSARYQAKAWAIEHTSRANLQQMEKDGRLFSLDQAPEIKGAYFHCTELQARELWERTTDADDPVERLMASIFGGKGNTQPFGLLIIRNSSTENVAVMAGRQALNFTNAFNRLVGLERSRRGGDRTKVWHLDRKGQGNRERQWLLNGSDNWPLPATNIDVPSIIKIVRESTRPISSR